MFDFIRDIASGIGSVVGTIVGIPVAIVAQTLGITVEMVNEATKAGCESYEEIRSYWKL